MDLTLFDRIRPYLSKALAAPIAIFLAWVAQKIGVADLSSTENQAAIISAIMWFVAEVIHVIIAKKTNPANAASAKLATEGAQEAK